MVCRIGLLVALSTLAIALPANGQDPGPTRVQMSPLEVHGQADAAFAEDVHQRLTRAVDDDPRLDAIVEGSASFRVQGHIHADERRRFVGLTLLDVATGMTVWSENYDYTNISPEMMAQDLIQALATASRPRDRE